MKKILLLLALAIISFGCIGQSKLKKGLYVGPDGVAILVDSIKSLGTYYAVYSGGVAQFLVKDTTTIAANTAKTTNATHMGDVTGATALTIAAGAVDAAMHSATGSPGATTFYRGDNTWNIPAGVPSGSSGYIQYNNGGAFGGSSAFLWDNDTTLLEIGNDFAATSVNPTILLSKDIFGAENGHGVSDENKIDLNAGKAYASFDNRITIIGTVDLSHSVGYQSAPTYSSTGTIDRLLGVTYVPTVTAGVVTSAIGYRLNDGVVSPGAEITNYYGLYASETINSATTNWFLYSAGTTKSYLGGDLEVEGILLNELTENGQVGETYTLVLTDANKVVTCTNANPVALTVPPNADVPFPLGTVIIIEQWGAGVVTVTEGAAVTVNSLNNNLALQGQYATASLRKDAENIWILSGAIE